MGKHNWFTVAFVAGVALGSIAVTTVIPAQARELTIASSGGDFQKAQKEVFFQPFEQASKVTVKDEAWDQDSLGLLRAKVQSGKPDWDVVLMEADFLQIGCDESLFEKIDWSKIGGKDIYVPSAVHNCGVGTVLYSTILAYDGDRVKEDPKSWRISST